MVGYSAQSAKREPGWIGREERTNVLLNGRARRTDGSEIAVLVHDISREGCRVECRSAVLDIGEWLEVEPDGLEPLRGQVRWSLLGSAGIRFDAAQDVS